MSDHDQLFKTLIRRFFGDLVRIVAPDLAPGLRLDRPRFEDGELFTDRPELLAPALAALMDPGELSPARYKLECLRRIARAEVDDAGRFLLVNCVETYVQWNDAAEEEYEALLAEEENQEVTIMEMTWGDRMVKKGRAEGLEAGRAQGRAEGRVEGRAEGLVEGRVEGMRTLVLGQIESRFGTVPADRRERIEAIDSTDELARLADRLLVARSLDDLDI